MDEDAGAITLELSIINPNPLLATTCEVVLSSGDPQDLEGFESTLVIFPAGSNSLQSLTVNITDDDLMEEQETFIFNITNVAGGDSATVSGNSSFVLTINPNDQESAVAGLIISEVMDGNRSGGQPKYLEFTNTRNTAQDISSFQIWRGSNGGAPRAVVTLPTGSVLESGNSWVIANNTGDMQAAGFSAPDQAASGINGNGNDVYQLRNAAGELIDSFGLVGVSSAWYENSVSQRLPSFTNGSASYDPTEWTITELATGLPANGVPGTPGTHVFEPVETVIEVLPAEFRLLAPFPNPFNSQITIPYALEQATSVSLGIYDLQGHLVQELLHDWQAAGSHTRVWTGHNTAGHLSGAGMYFARLELANQEYMQSQVAKIVLLK